jgi:hypothetical protein
MVGLVHDPSFVFVDETSATAGTETSMDEVPELVEPARWDMRQPEAEEHVIESSRGRPREEIGLDVGDVWISDTLAIECEHLR